MSSCLRALFENNLLSSWGWEVEVGGVYEVSLQISESPNPFISPLLKAPRGLGREEDGRPDSINMPQDWPLILIYKYASIASVLHDSYNPLSGSEHAGFWYIGKSRQCAARRMLDKMRSSKCFNATKEEKNDVTMKRKSVGYLQMQLLLHH